MIRADLFPYIVTGVTKAAIPLLPEFLRSLCNFAERGVLYRMWFTFFRRKANLACTSTGYINWRRGINILRIHSWEFRTNFLVPFSIFLFPMWWFSSNFWVMCAHKHNSRTKWVLAQREMRNTSSLVWIHPHSALTITIAVLHRLTLLSYYAD